MQCNLDGLEKPKSAISLDMPRYSNYISSSIQASFSDQGVNG